MLALAGYVLPTLRFEVYVMCLLERSRVITSALCFHICCSIGRRCASISSAALDVALYAPHMALAALACILCRVLSIFFVYILPLALAFDQIEQAYIICGSAVASYSLRMSEA